MATVAFSQATNDTQRAAARVLGEEGLTAFERGDFEIAIDRFERAYRLMKVPTLGLWSGRALARSGKLVAASERLLSASRIPVTEDMEPMQATAQRDAETEREHLLAKIPTLRVDVDLEPSSPTAFVIDGAAMPNAAFSNDLPLDPGDHVVGVSWGSCSATQHVSMVEGTAKQIRLNRPASCSSAKPMERSSSGSFVEIVPRTGNEGPSSATRTLGWVLLGVGAAGVATWSTTGLFALSKRGSLSTNCPDGSCPPAYYDDLDQYQTLRTVSTIGFVTSVIGAGAGVALLLSAPKTRDVQTSTIAWRARVGLDGFRIEGSY